MQGDTCASKGEQALNRVGEGGGIIMAIAFGQMAILLSQGAALRNPIKSEQRQQKMRMPNTNCKWQ